MLRKKCYFAFNILKHLQWKHKLDLNYAQVEVRKN